MSFLPLLLCKFILSYFDVLPPSIPIVSVYIVFHFLFIRLYPSFQRVCLFLNCLESLRWVFFFSPIMVFYGLHMFLILDENFVATPWILQVCALELKHFVLHFGGTAILSIIAEKNKFNDLSRNVQFQTLIFINCLLYITGAIFKTFVILQV